MPLTATLIIISFSPPTLSFIPDFRAHVKIASRIVSYCIVSYCYSITYSLTYLIRHAFSALTLLVARQEEYPACKNCVMTCWCGYPSGARCRLFAYGPADAAASKTPSSLSSFKSRLVLAFWYRLTQDVQEKRPLNGCSSTCLHHPCILLVYA